MAGGNTGDDRSEEIPGSAHAWIFHEWLLDQNQDQTGEEGAAVIHSY